MTALVWMLAWLPQLLQAMGELPQPVDLNLTSSHFRHMLKWAPGPGTPTGVCHRVTVITESGTFWRPVAGCECVHEPLVCNLTETFSDPYQVYFTQVTAVLEAQTSKPVTHPGFKPIKDTHLDLPLLTVTPCGRDLCVDLQPPMQHLREIYQSLSYKLQISAKKVQVIKDTRFLKREVLKDLAPGREYCVSVCISDNLTLRKSNYSQPVCAFTSNTFAADALVAAMLCVLVMFGVVALALLVYTGFICLKVKRLPSVLTSISHMEEVLVTSPCSASLSSCVDLKATVPSSVEKRSSQASHSSAEEAGTESTAGCPQGGYELKGITNLLFSSSSSAVSAPLYPKPEPPPSFSSDQMAHTHIHTHTHPQPDGLTETLSTHLNCVSDECVPPGCPPADSPSLTGGRVKPKEEEEEEENSSDVNLLTLTFGREEEEEEEGEESHCYVKEAEPESSSSSQVYNTGILPSQTCETLLCSSDEEDEFSGYMRRPCKDAMKNLM